MTHRPEGLNDTFTNDLKILGKVDGVAADHSVGSSARICNICYGTGDPPTASTTPIGTLFVKYTA